MERERGGRGRDRDVHVHVTMKLHVHVHVYVIMNFIRVHVHDHQLGRGINGFIRTFSQENGICPRHSLQHVTCTIYYYAWLPWR